MYMSTKFKEDLCLIKKGISFIFDPLIFTSIGLITILWCLSTPPIEKEFFHQVGSKLLSI